MQTHFLFQYGEIRNESKDVAAYHGSFGHKRIKVDHQLQRTSQMQYVIQEPKTESG